MFKKKSKSKELPLNEIEETFNTFINLVNEANERVYYFCLKHLEEKLKNAVEGTICLESCLNPDLLFNDKSIGNYLSCISKDIVNTTLDLYAEKDLLDKIHYLKKLWVIFNSINFNLLFKQHSSVIRLARIQREPYKKYELKDEYNIINNLRDENPIVSINDAKSYDMFVEILKQLENKTEIDLFNQHQSLLDKYKNQTLEEYDLSNINFDGKNLSGIDISRNPEVHINFDKIVKDLTNSNISGYNLNKYTFRNYNLTNTDLRNTGATIDLASCIINKSSKMGSGTLFDENNKFVFMDKKLSSKDIKVLGLKLI